MYVFAAIALALGLLVSVFNWATSFISRPDKHVSPAPLVGGILLGVGLLGFNLTRPYWWLAVFIDFGTLMLLFALPPFLYETWAHSDSNAKHMFVSVEGDRTIDIKLFNNGDAAINISFDPPRPYGDIGNLAFSRGFAAKWVPSDNQFKLYDYAGGRELLIQPRDDGLILAESCPEGDDPSICSLDRVRATQRHT